MALNWYMGLSKIVKISQLEVEILGIQNITIVTISPYKLTSESLNWFLICIIFTIILF